VGEHFPAKITIGGAIPAKLVPILAQAIEDQEVVLGGGYEGLYCTATEATLAIMQAANNGHMLDLSYSQAAYGQFADLEEFCAANGIAFDRHSDGHDEYDAEICRYRPGMRDAFVSYASGTGDDLIAVDHLDTILASDASPAEKLEKIYKLAHPVPYLTAISITNPPKKGRRA
jgi:hypothetical protein